jgi:hypothetical protein
VALHDGEVTNQAASGQRGARAVGSRGQRGQDVGGFVGRAGIELFRVRTSGTRRAGALELAAASAAVTWRIAMSQTCVRRETVNGRGRPARAGGHPTPLRHP